MASMAMENTVMVMDTAMDTAMATVMDTVMILISIQR